MKLNQEVDGILNKFTDDAALKAFAKELMDRHVQFKMDPALWSVSRSASVYGLSFVVVRHHKFETYN